MGSFRVRSLLGIAQWLRQSVRWSRMTGGALADLGVVRMKRGWLWVLAAGGLLVVAVVASPFVVGVLHRLSTPSEAATEERLSATQDAAERLIVAGIGPQALSRWDCAGGGYSGMWTSDGQIVCDMDLAGSYEETVLDILGDAAEAAGGSAITGYRTGDYYELSSPPPSRSTIRLGNEGEQFEFYVYWDRGTNTASLRVITDVFIRD
jgi:hypothetical protein